MGDVVGVGKAGVAIGEQVGGSGVEFFDIENIVAESAAGGGDFEGVEAGGGGFIGKQRIAAIGSAVVVGGDEIAGGVVKFEDGVEGVGVFVGAVAGGCGREDHGMAGDEAEGVLIVIGGAQEGLGGDGYQAVIEPEERGREDHGRSRRWWIGRARGRRY